MSPEGGGQGISPYPPTCCPWGWGVLKTRAQGCSRGLNPGMKGARALGASVGTVTPLPRFSASLTSKQTFGEGPPGPRGGFLRREAGTLSPQRCLSSPCSLLSPDPSSHRGAAATDCLRLLLLSVLLSQAERQEDPGGTHDPTVRAREMTEKPERRPPTPRPRCQPGPAALAPQDKDPRLSPGQAQGPGR